MWRLKTETARVDPSHEVACLTSAHGVGGNGRLGRKNLDIMHVWESFIQVDQESSSKKFPTWRLLVNLNETFSEWCITNLPSMLSVAKEQNLRCTQLCAAEACPSTMLHSKLSKGRVSVEGLWLLHSQRFSLKKKFFGSLPQYCIVKDPHYVSHLLFLNIVGQSKVPVFLFMYTSK